MIPTLILPPEEAGAEPEDAGAELPHAASESVITDAIRTANTLFIITFPPEVKKD
jgi:hypothetical protein